MTALERDGHDENGMQHGWRHWPGASGTATPRSTLTLRGLPAGSDRLNSAGVFVHGLGAVGGIAFDGFARLGIGRLSGADPDSYGVDSRWTQPCTAADAGRPKALLA